MKVAGAVALGAVLGAVVAVAMVAAANRTTKGREVLGTDAKVSK